MPFKTCYLSITRYDSLSTVNTAHLISGLCWSRGRWTPHRPPPQFGGRSCLCMQLCGEVYLKADHGDEMELRPKVRSCLDAAWILIWTSQKSDSEFQSSFSSVPNGISPSKKLQYYANETDLIFFYAIRILNSVSRQTSCNIP